MASISSNTQLPNDHVTVEQPILLKCTGRCHRELPPSEFVNLRDSTKTTRRCLQCRNANNNEVNIYFTLLQYYY
jgi:hypothetical protein